MTDDKIVEQARTAVMDMAIGDIHRASAGGAKMGAFILAACVIDYLTCLHIGGDSNRTEYPKFIDEFFANSPYNSEDLYVAIRCKLVHNYTVKDAKYFFVDNNPQAHMATNKVTGQTVINLEDFVNDLEMAAKRYFEHVESDNDAKARLVSRVKDVGILGVLAPIVIQIS